MSTEYIVNRIDQGPFVQAEAEKLKLGGIRTDEQPDPAFALQKDVESPTPEDMAVMAESAPLIDELLDNPIIQKEAEKQGYQPNEELLSQFRALVGAEDHKAFRSQVIRAFKHLGLDTRHFFGE